MSCIPKYTYQYQYDNSPCPHERHADYISEFRYVWDNEFYQFITEYILDPKISPDDADDLDLFQSFVFSNRLGNQYFYYVKVLSLNEKIQIKEKSQIFCRFLDFLNQLSPLFRTEAVDYLIRLQKYDLIESVFCNGTLDIKMDIIKKIEQDSGLIKHIPKLKLYNIFS